MKTNIILKRYFIFLILLLKFSKSNPIKSLGKAPFTSGFLGTHLGYWDTNKTIKNSHFKTDMPKIKFISKSVLQKLKQSKRPNKHLKSTSKVNKINISKNKR